MKKPSAYNCSIADSIGRRLHGDNLIYFRALPSMKATGERHFRLIQTLKERTNTTHQTPKPQLKNEHEHIFKQQLENMREEMFSLKIEYSEIRNTLQREKSSTRKLRNQIEELRASRNQIECEFKSAKQKNCLLQQTIERMSRTINKQKIMSTQSREQIMESFINYVPGQIQTVSPLQTNTLFEIIEATVTQFNFTQDKENQWKEQRKDQTELHSNNCICHLKPKKCAIAPKQVNLKVQGLSFRQIIVDPSQQSLSLQLNQQIHLLESKKMEFLFLKNSRICKSKDFSCANCEKLESLFKQTFAILAETFKKIKFQVSQEEEMIYLS